MQFHAIMVVEHTCNAGFDEWAYHQVTGEQRDVKEKYYTGHVARCEYAPLSIKRGTIGEVPGVVMMSYDVI